MGDAPLGKGLQDALDMETEKAFTAESDEMVKFAPHVCIIAIETRGTLYPTLLQIVKPPEPTHTQING